MNWSSRTCRGRADVEERRQILALTEQEFARRFFGDAAPGLISQAHRLGGLNEWHEVKERLGRSPGRVRLRPNRGFPHRTHL
jgi:hypothetical protein